MGEAEGKQGAAFPSEASRMLEAALEQMDGIIQGAKYELPHYFDNFSIQVCLFVTSLWSYLKSFPPRTRPSSRVKWVRQ